MKRAQLVILLILSTLMVRAQLSSMLEFSAGGGWSSLGYKVGSGNQELLNVQQTGSYGFTAHIGYGLMFNKYVGLGIGADFSRYGSTAKLGGATQWKGVLDTDGERYDHTTEISNWKDAQALYMLEVPLSVYLRAPLPNEKSWFSAVVGAKVGIPMMSSGKYSGDLMHTAGYEPWQLVLQDVRGHGFYSSSMSNNYSLSPRISCAAFAKVGFETALDKKQKLFFFGHIYATYYFLNTLNFSDQAKDLGFINDSEDNAMRQAHYFMDEYTSILDTKHVNQKSMPIGVGIELGLRVRFPHKHKNCHCNRD